MCHQWKLETDFAFRSIATGERQGHCRVCHAAYRRQHYLDHRDDYIAREVARMKRYREANRILIRDYLRKHPCVDCGEADIVLLEFDHRDRSEKRREVVRLAMTKRWQTVEAEIQKCDVRCTACHRRRTAQQMNWTVQRGVAPIVEPPPPTRLSIAGTRRCTGCGVLKPATEFSLKNKRTGRQSTRCLACVAAASRAHYERNRETYLARARGRTRWTNPKAAYKLDYLRTHPCVDCGESDPLLLDFDHRRGETKVNDVSRLIWERKWEIVKAEIAKCDVRCVRCHRRKTAQQFRWSRLGEDPMIYVYAGVL